MIAVDSWLRWLQTSNKILIRGNVCRGNDSGKCRSGKCLSGEKSVQEKYSRGNVCRGKVPRSIEGRKGGSERGEKSDLGEIDIRSKMRTELKKKSIKGENGWKKES